MFGLAPVTDKSTMNSVLLGKLPGRCKFNEVFILICPYIVKCIFVKIDISMTFAMFNKTYLAVLTNIKTNMTNI